MSKVRSLNENTVNENPPGSGNLFLWIILAGALVLRWVHLLIVSDSDLVRLPIIDAAFYHQWATAISNGDIIGNKIFFMSPLYPYITGFFYAVFGALPWRMMAVQGLISVVTVWLLYRWTSRVAGRRAGLIAAGIAAVYGPFIFYDSTLLTSSLILFISALILNFTQDALDNGNIGSLWKLGLAIGLSSLARPLALIFLPFVFLAFYINDRTTSFKRSLLVLVSTLILMIPVGIRNLIVGGELTLTTSSAGMNFYVGNNEDATGLYWEAPFLSSVEPQYEDEEYRLLASRAIERELTTREAGGFWMRKSFDWIIKHPGDYAKLLARKAFYFWSRAEFANNVSCYLGKAESPLLRFNPFGFWLIGPFGLAGLILMWKRRRWRRAQVPWLWLMAYFTGAMIFFVASEYRLPVLLTLFAGVGYLISEIVSHIRSRQWEPIMGIVVLALIFMPITNLRTNFIKSGENPRMDYFNLGNTYIKHGNYSKAIACFNKALEVDPYFEEGLHRLADAYYRNGMSDKAVEIGKRVGLKPPEDILKIVRGDALRSAYMLLDAGNFDAAIDEFAYAGWDSGKAAAETTRVSLLMQARVAFGQGRPDETLELFQQIRADDEFPNPSISFNIAFLFRQFNKLDSAEFYAGEALSIDSMNVPAAMLLADIYDLTDRLEDANRLRIRVNPNAADHKAILEEVRFEMDSLAAIGEWYDALEAYSRYGKYGYTSLPEDKLRIGRLQLEVGNLELSFRLLTDAEAGGIHSPMLYYHKGRVQLALEDTSEALTSFQRVVEIESDMIPARIALAKLYAAQGKTSKALRELESVSHLKILNPDLDSEYNSLRDSLISVE